ncbi:uncharacterized protein [Henckelia pumila]|uniref:uncharacterized protein isoform X2 n=1 Tax=Henckelia pumila TaxID=405737 RepID=UPI003C6E6D51
MRNSQITKGRKMRNSQVYIVSGTRKEKNRNLRPSVARTLSKLRKNIIARKPRILTVSTGVMELPSFRGMCDFCKAKETGNPYTRLCGGGVTFVNADKLVDLRYMSELVLKFYNDNTSRSFKLLKVCKINCSGFGYFGLTFRAQEDGSEECPTFQGVVLSRCSENKALFCEIKIGPLAKGMVLAAADFGDS